MKQEDFSHTTETNKSFEEAIIAVLKSIEKKGWTVFNIYDIQERLAAKGFSHQPLKIIEICSAKHANTILSKNRLASLCMPCKINILEEKGKIKIATIKPTIISQLFTEITKQDTDPIENDLKEIIDESR